MDTTNNRTHFKLYENKMNENRKYNKNRMEMYEDMLDTHGFAFCQYCGNTKGGLETHHLIFRSEKPQHQHLNSKKNLIIVCRKCHENFHNDKGARNRIVEQRELSELFGTDILNK